MNASWIIPFIILGGALQSCGATMNGQLNKSLLNPWLASAVSAVLIVFFFIGAFFVMPNPLPTTKDIASMPWWLASVEAKTTEDHIWKVLGVGLSRTQ